MTFREAVYRLVQGVPRGRVVTYGQVASLLGRPRAARAVGYALGALRQPGSGQPYHAANVPWQRVINRLGGISGGGQDARALLQRQLLVDEGIAFGTDACCALERHRWSGPYPGWLSAWLQADFGTGAKEHSS